MTRLLHIADLHFGDESRPLVDSLAEYCLSHPPGAVIATGDFTQAGRRREFDQARSFFESLNVPVIGAPGNHDVPVYALDHRFLDEINDLGPATMENLSRWIWDRLQPVVGNLFKVSVYRDSSGEACSYWGEEISA